MNRSSSKAKFDLKPYLQPGVSEGELESIKQNFDLFDPKRTGFINPKQIKEVLANMGPEVRNKTVYQLICDFDSEGSGTMSFEQFVHLNLRKLVPNDSRENTKCVFSLFDDEKSGYISIKSFRRIARDLGMEIDDQDFEEMVACADFDCDGLISEEEFYQFVNFSKAS